MKKKQYSLLVSKTILGNSCLTETLSGPLVRFIIFINVHDYVVLSNFSGRT